MKLKFIKEGLSLQKEKASVFKPKKCINSRCLHTQERDRRNKQKHNNKSITGWKTAMYIYIYVFEFKKVNLRET